VYHLSAKAFLDQEVLYQFGDSDARKIIAVFGSPGKFTVSLHFLARKRAQPDKHDPLGIFGIIILCLLPDAGTKCIVFCYSPCYNTPHVDKRGASL
jgi:hypothetical protein